MFPEHPRWGSYGHRGAFGARQRSCRSRAVAAANRGIPQCLVPIRGESACGPADNPPKRYKPGAAAWLGFRPWRARPQTPGLAPWRARRGAGPPPLRGETAAAVVKLYNAATPGPTAGSRVIRARQKPERADRRAGLRQRVRADGPGGALSGRICGNIFYNALDTNPS